MSDNPRHRERDPWGWHDIPLFLFAAAACGALGVYAGAVLAWVLQ